MGRPDKALPCVLLVGYAALHQPHTRSPAKDLHNRILGCGYAREDSLESDCKLHRAVGRSHDGFLGEGRGFEVLGPFYRRFGTAFTLYYFFPLHMTCSAVLIFAVTGRARGGNDIRLKFNSRTTSLHSVWDGLLITKLQQTLVPPRTHYDDFLNYLLAELETRYLNSTTKWLGCPFPTSGTRQVIINDVHSTSIVAHEGCVENWMEETHQLNCNGVWSFDAPEVARETFLVERDVVAEFWAEEYGIEEIYEEIYGEFFDVDLSQGKYWEWVLQEDIIQKMLIRGGVRLAGVLNGIFEAEY
jgi:hypothetical protein